MAEKVTSNVVKIYRLWTELRKMKEQKRRDALAITFFNSLDVGIRRSKKQKPSKRQKKSITLIWAGHPATLWTDFIMILDLLQDFSEFVEKAGGKINVVPNTEWGWNNEEKREELYLTIRFSVDLKGLKRWIVKQAYDNTRARWSPKKKQ